MIWDIKEKTNKRIIQAKITCSACKEVFGVHEGIGVFITNKFNEVDLWKEVDSNLLQAVNESPDIEHKLLKTALDKLNPADQLLRSMILDERGNYNEAKETASLSETGLYTDEYLTCSKKSRDFLTNSLKGKENPILDIASGRGGLVEGFINELTNPIILSDVSPTVLLSNKKKFSHFGWYDRISLIAFDARNIPFKNQSITLSTTFHGLTNIYHTDLFFTELSRVLSRDGQFMGITTFFEESDKVHRAETEKLNLNFTFKSQTKEIFNKLSLKVNFENECRSFVKPTPKSEIFGINIDGIPVKDTVMIWNVLHLANN
ncbi:MAG: class I SAM-dependent methyltransferase [Candidatus Hodarchaeales archaeon]